MFLLSLPVVCLQHLPWPQPRPLPLKAPPLRKYATPRRRRTSPSPCWAPRVVPEVRVLKGLELEGPVLWGGGAASSPKMDGATCASSTSADEGRCTCVTSGRLFWTCSGATSSSCSRPPLLGPGSCLGCFGIWWQWCMETYWVSSWSESSKTKRMKVVWRVVISFLKPVDRGSWTSVMTSS